MNHTIEKTSRMCNNKPETTVHLMSGCQTLLASRAYTHRLNNICRLTHRRISEHFNIPRPPNFWKHEHQTLIKNNQIEIYYDYPVPIGRHVQGGCMKPDISLHNKMDKTVHIIEVGVTGDTSLNATELRKIKKISRF